MFARPMSQNFGTSSSQASLIRNLVKKPSHSIQIPPQFDPQSFLSQDPIEDVVMTDLDRRYQGMHSCLPRAGIYSKNAQVLYAMKAPSIPY